MTNQIILSPEGKKKIELELEDLKKNKRRQIADRITTAKEFGDLSENAEYHDAKEEQAFIEGHILELEHIIKTARVMDKTGSATVHVGSDIKLSKDDKDLELKIVGATEADPSQGKISVDSPLGEALMGKKSGEEFDLQTPGGLSHYKITKVS